MEISDLEPELADSNADELMDALTENSLASFRSNLAGKYKGNRHVFEEDALWRAPDEFLKEYPVVLSTTYTARSSLGKNAMFDYVIMDESSQVDVVTGFLALTNAMNAVIVGDRKQLPNVVSSDSKTVLQGIFNISGVSASYSYVDNSFLGSVTAVFNDKVPRTVLQEHYRCDPRIIGFCNRKFYDDGLILMTESSDNALELFETVPGMHSRDHSNLRQAEVLRDEILPNIDCPLRDIGIIVPYNNQVRLLRQVLNRPDIEVATIHKFQGKEKDVIIFLTTDDFATSFSDDPNLLNVAVSRARRRFVLVASGNDQPAGSNTADLIGYIRYNNGIVHNSAISSIFDYLYRQYDQMRYKLLSRHKIISRFDSENLMYGLILDAIKDRTALGVLSNHPLYQLILDDSVLNEEEKRFVRTRLSHLDFLIYNKVSKTPVLAIEVDGRTHETPRQAHRDELKNHIMELYGIPLIRFTTNGSREREKLTDTLNRILWA